MSKVENIHHIVNKKVASYTNYTILMRHQHKYYYWCSHVFVKRGLKRGPRLKREGDKLFLDLIGPYMYHIPEFMVISSRQKLQSLNDYTMNIHIDGVPINQSNQSKSLGLIIDENLSWKAHIHEISKKVSSCIGALKRVRPFVSMHTAIKIYKALIEPHFDYCSAVWDGLTQQLSEKLQKLQNRAIRVITKSSYDTSSRLLLTSLGWDNLSSRRAKQKANLMYKCINNLAPAYLCNLFLPRIPSYDFRNAKKKLLLPKPRTDYLKHSFSYSGAILWNNLPEEIRTSNSLAFFKRSYNKLFSDQYSHTANM